jgi:hypothetical protein
MISRRRSLEYPRLIPEYRMTSEERTITSTAFVDIDVIAARMCNVDWRPIVHVVE